MSHEMCWLLSVAAMCAACATALGEGPPRRNEWYRNATLIIHCDNHSALLGKGASVEELVSALRTVPCDMIQVSAQSNTYATYPTEVGLNHPDAEGYDTLATFKEVTKRLGIKFCIYMSVDRRPTLIKDHPEFARIAADGKIPAQGEPVVCQRPDKERKGYLYEKFIPQIEEIIRKYDPDGFWFDGDYILARPCWCERCLKAWKDEKGGEAPRDDKAPPWGEWMQWHYARHQEYRRVVAEAIHAASPKAMYTSNWSWAWTPEPTPDFADSLSGDEWNIRQVICATLRWGAQQKTPWDMMSYAVPDSRSLSRQHSLQRTLQEGALTMASGGVWFAWTFAGHLPPQGVQVTRLMGHFAQDRKPAIGPSVSLAHAAVLDSETAWRQGGETGMDGPAVSAARCLQEARYFTDIVNEETFRARLTPYQVVVVPSQRALAPETLEQLRRFVEEGGLLVLTGQSPSFVELKRSEETGKPTTLELDKRYVIMGSWTVEPGGAQVLAQFKDGRPALISRPAGKGTVAYLAAARVGYPDQGLMAAVLRKLGRGPSYSAETDRPVVCTLRRKPGKVVLHVCDLSARIAGEPADVDTAGYTDWNPPISSLKIALAVSAEPKRVTAVPALTQLKSRYANGILTLELGSVQTHAAVVMESDGEPVFGALPPETPAAKTGFHPESERRGVVFADDFETTDAGRKPQKPWVPEVRGATDIVVTEETAAGGRRALKFVDTADSSFWPFLHRSVGPFYHGRARLAFDLRVDPRASCLVELRYENKGAGPSVRFDGDGNVAAGGKRLTRTAPGKWFRVAIEFELGTEKPAYSVSVAQEGRKAETFKDIGYASEWFFLCNSVYFVGSGNEPGNFYLDNVTLERL